MANLQPAPLSEPFMKEGRISPVWQRWLHQLREFLADAASIGWTVIDKTGSNLTDLATRRHRDLQDLQGGTTAEYYHLTSAQHTEATTFFASTDLTAAEAETLSNGSNADALHVHAISKKVVDDKSGAYTVVAGDIGKIINVDATAGAVTLTLTAAATLTDGFWCYVRKADSSVNSVTIDPNAAETINGAATLALTVQYSMRLIVCDSTGWFATL